MKVLALGGCGEMGRHAVRTLLARRACDNIIIADRDAGSAEQFSAACGNKTSWLELDITDPQALRKAIRDADLVMNTVGPYFRFGKMVLSACIEAGRNYVDICDDWEPTLDMLDLHEQARQAGMTALIGMGASPGITNILAKRAARELDRVTELYTGWDLESAIPEKIGKTPSAATIHGFHQMTGKIRVFSGGRFVEARPVQKITLDYPGLGRHAAWTIGHPESVTMPRYFEGLRISQNVMIAPRISIAALKLVTALVNAGVISVYRAAWIGERFEGSAGAVDDWGKRKQALSRRPALPPLFALARGEKNGRETAVGVMALSAPSGGMAGVTGVPLAAGVELVLRRKITTPGVFAPEGVVEADDLLNLVARFCKPEMKGADDLVLVSRSWESPDILSQLKARGL
jgi:saccharopine dehydrogenase-like NADP-dependent oxidoreductase